MCDYRPYNTSLQVPSIASSKEIQLECGPEMLVVNFSIAYKKLEILLPYPVTVRDTLPTLDVLNHILIIKCKPDAHFYDEIENIPDPGSKPWLLAAAVSLFYFSLSLSLSPSSLYAWIR
jgi:hypothetical protein